MNYKFCQSDQNSKVLNNNPRFYHFSYYLVPSSIYESVALTVIEESDKMSLASKLASNIIKKAPSGPVRISCRRFINWGSSQMIFCSWILAVLSKFIYLVYIKSLKADDKTVGQRHQFPKIFWTSQQTFLPFLFCQGFRSVTFLLLREAQFSEKAI